MTNQNVPIKRILIVDDEAAIVSLCQRVLSSEGFDVESAANGKEAQALINEREYDLYLLDFKMPAMDGKELYQWLRKTYPHSADRVIFVTGSSLGEATDSLIRDSGRPLLNKPFTTTELLGAIKEWLGK